MVSTYCGCCWSLSLQIAKGHLFVEPRRSLIRLVEYQMRFIAHRMEYPSSASYKESRYAAALEPCEWTAPALPVLKTAIFFMPFFCQHHHHHFPCPPWLILFQSFSIKLSIKKQSFSFIKTPYAGVRRAAATSDSAIGGRPGAGNPVNALFVDIIARSSQVTPPCPQ